MLVTMALSACLDPLFTMEYEAALADRATLLIASIVFANLVEDDFIKQDCPEI